MPGLWPRVAVLAVPGSGGPRALARGESDALWHGHLERVPSKKNRQILKNYLANPLTLPVEI